MAGDEQPKPASPNSPARAAAQQWYLLRNGQQIGPISSKQLQQVATSNQMTPEDLVWREGYADWVPAKRVKGLFAAAHDELPIAQDIAVQQSAVPSFAAQATAAPLWYYRKGDSVFGPIPEDGLKAMHVAGSLRPGDFVRREGTQQWTVVGNPVSASPASAAGTMRAPVVSTKSPKAHMRREQIEPGEPPSLINSLVVWSFVLGGPSILLHIIPLYQYLLLSRISNELVPGNLAIQAADTWIAPQMLMHLIYVLFGVVAVIAAFGLILEKHFGWVVGLLAAGFSFAIGLYNAQILWAAIQAYVASSTIPFSSFITVSIELTLALLAFITFAFVGHSLLGFYALLRKRATRFYRRAKA